MNDTSSIFNSFFNPFRGLRAQIGRQRDYHKNSTQSPEGPTQTHSHAILESWQSQVYAHDTKSNCGLYSCGLAGYLTSSFKIENILPYVSAALRARFHVTDGGGDGGGIAVKCSPESLARYHKCDEKYFKGSGRLVQISFAENETLRKEQLSTFKAFLAKKNIQTITEIWPETDFTCLRDGQNAEREKQGILYHMVIKKPDAITDKEFDNICTQLVASWNVNEKRKDLESTNYSPSGINAITQDTIICKSFQANGILDLFPFLKAFDCIDLSFHGREATNTGPQRFSIHPTAEITVMHNGEINNIKTIRQYLSISEEFKTFTGWEHRLTMQASEETQSSITLFNVLSSFSDTHIIALYSAFKDYTGTSPTDTLRSIFRPNNVEHTRGFRAEGPATILLRNNDGSLCLVNDPQSQRPVYMDVLTDRNGRYIGYRIGSIPSIKTPASDTLKWVTMQVHPGIVKKITPINNEHGEILYFHIEDLEPIEDNSIATLNVNGTLTNTENPKTLKPKTSLDAETLATTLRLERSREDHETVVAMGDQSIPSSAPRLCNAGVTNTSNSLGIDPHDAQQSFCVEAGRFITTDHPVLSHEQYNCIHKAPNVAVVSACISKQRTQDLVDQREGLLNEVDRICLEVESAIKQGARTIDLRFVEKDKIPLFPREILANRISELLVKHGKDGLTDPDDKINFIITTNSTSHGQDAFTLLSAGAHFIYHPHITEDTGEQYFTRLSKLREAVSTLAMRTGTSRLSQLSASSLFYYQDNQETADLLGVPNIGGNRFTPYTALQEAFMAIHRVNRDLGIQYNSSHQRLTTEMAVDLQDPNTHELAQRQSTRKNPALIETYPTEKTSLKPIICVFGSGAAGISYIETLPVGVYKIILVEKATINRVGNTKHISGDHKSMRESAIHRFQSILERPDVEYAGGLRQTDRDKLAQYADHIIDARGTTEDESEGAMMTSRDFLSFAYAGPDVFSNQSTPIPKHFTKPREFPGIIIRGVGEISFDVLNALLGQDERTREHARLFTSWKTQFQFNPIYILARRGPESLKWKESYIIKLLKLIQKEPNLGPLRIYSPDNKLVPQILQNYWTPETDIAHDGINLVFNTTVQEYDETKGNVSLDRSGNSYTLPFIGLTINGFVPMIPQQSLTSHSVAPITELGWSSKTGNMADIQQDATRLELPSISGGRSVKTRKNSHEQLDHLLTSASYVEGKTQQEINIQLLENPNATDAELVALLNRKPDDISLKEIEATTDQEPEQESNNDYEKQLKEVGLEENQLTVIIPGERPEHIPVTSTDKDVLDIIIKHYRLNKEDATSCAGEGTCSDCAGIVNMQDLPIQGPSESAILRGFTKRFPTQHFQTRTTCQIPFTPTTGGAISFPKNSPMATAIKTIKRTFATSRVVTPSLRALPLLQIGLKGLRRIR